MKNLLFFLTGGFVSVAFLVLGGLAQKSDRLFATLDNLFKPPRTEITIPDSRILLKQIQSMQELTTTVYKLETIVPTSADFTWGQDWKIATTKLLYLAKGEVRAGIDLSQLTADDIQIEDDKISISLPIAKILDSKIDVKNSQVYHYDRGFLNLGPDVAPKLQTLAQQKTLAKLIARACEDQILEDANQQAKETIANFLTLTNQNKVEIISPDPSQQKCGEVNSLIPTNNNVQISNLVSGQLF